MVARQAVEPSQLALGGGLVGWLAAAAAVLAAGADAEDGAKEEDQATADADVEKSSASQLVPVGKVEVDDG